VAVSHRHLDPETVTAGLPGEWAAEARRALTALQEALTPDDDDAECPVCLGAGLLSDQGPALLDRVSDLSARVAETLREAVPEAGDPTAAAYDRTSPTHRAAAPTTVRINVSD